MITARFSTFLFRYRTANSNFGGGRDKSRISGCMEVGAGWRKQIKLLGNALSTQACKEIGDNGLSRKTESMESKSGIGEEANE